MEMDRVKRLADEIRLYCSEHQNPELAAKYARYFREGYDSWGLMDGKSEVWEDKKREWFERYRSLGLPGFLRYGAQAFRHGKYEEGALAIQFVARLLDEFDLGHLKEMEKWFDSGVRNWAHADVLCSLVLGPLLERRQIDLKALAGWRESKWKYQRRTVPVAMINLVRAGNPVEPLLEFVTPLMMDEERVVHQGVGWFLREAWKKRPDPVERLLLEWKDRAARLIYQYATEKMSAPEKNRFRRAPVKARGKSRSREAGI
jgi:3-methyladenine DNA glycosylase AlkD